jgi:hypothetical protein
MRQSHVKLLLAATCGVALLSGCITVEEPAKPKSSSDAGVVSSDMDWSRVATTDGSRIVARGKPPLTFIYPGTGRLSVRNLDTNSILFSIELPQGTPNERTQVSISAEGKFTGRTAAGITDLGSVNPKHTFVITYLPAEQMK